MFLMKTFLQRTRLAFTQYTKLTRRVIVGTVGSGFLLSAELVRQAPESKPKVQRSSESLSTEKLVENASNLASESACSLHFQASLAYMEALQNYSEAVGHLIGCLEFAVKNKSGVFSDDQVWEKIIEARHRMNEWKSLKMERQQMMMNAEKLLGLAAEISFAAGSEFAAITANERLLSVQSRLSVMNKSAEEAEKKLAESEAKMIKITASKDREKKP